MARADDPRSWSAEQGYEARVGRWSRRAAGAFLDWLALPTGGHWLDLGCGTGALTQAILERAAPRRVVGIDPSGASLAYAHGQVSDGRAGFVRAAAEQLPFPPDAFDAAVSGLALNFMSDEAGAVGEMRKVVRPGGPVAAYVWDFAGEMQLMRRFWDAARTIDPDAVRMDQGERFPICKPEPLVTLLRGAGLDGVETRAIDVPTVFVDFDDYWAPMGIGSGSIAGYCQSLSEAQRSALAEQLKRSLPFAPDGSISLIARAWAVRGLVPR